MVSITLDELPISPALLAELRSDHAGEYGAVAIYQGILAVARKKELTQFAQHHLQTEADHLAFLENVLAPQHRTRLLPLWKLAGWSLGVLPTLIGPHAVYVTIEAVEQFVEQHYQRQLTMMKSDPALHDLYQTLEQFCADEVEHKSDAAYRRQPNLGLLARFWSHIVGKGSALAVVVAKRV
jgi:ubiquinone biosynthesis monooxygenase Coq7